MAAGFLDQRSPDEFRKSLALRLSRWLDLLPPVSAPFNSIPEALFTEAATRFGSLKWNRKR
jgi:hypothetical protein